MIQKIIMFLADVTGVTEQIESEHRQEIAGWLEAGKHWLTHYDKPAEKALEVYIEGLRGGYRPKEEYLREMVCGEAAASGMRKRLKPAYLRVILNMYHSEKITFSRMVEMINQKLNASENNV